MNDSVTRRGLLQAGCILPDVAAASPQEAFRHLAGALAATHGIDAAALVERLCAREARGSSVVSHGIALPHADAWGLTRPHAAFLRSPTPIRFHVGEYEVPVHEVLVLVAPRPATAIHYAMLLHYRTLLVAPSFRAVLRRARDPLAIWQVFREHEWHRDARPGQRTHGEMHAPASGPSPTGEARNPSPG